MRRRPRILDAFCGGGGAAWGYHQAGFDVVGIDVAPMPQYPFLDLIQGDALLWLADPDFLAEFDAVHASPPCKVHTPLAALHRAGPYAPHHEDLIPATRELLVASGLPWVIENVVGSALRNPTVLCGTMFGLGLGDAVLKRHRLFESNIDLGDPPADACAGRPVVGVYGTGGGVDPEGARGWWHEGQRPRRCRSARHRLDRAPARPLPSDPARLHPLDRRAANRPHRTTGCSVRIAVLAAAVVLASAPLWPSWSAGE